VEVGRAILSECTARMMELLPSSSSSSPAMPALPVCFDGFALIAGDGKKIKNAAKRLAPTRGYSGKLIGAKALVAMDLRSGMAVAMSDSLDGLSNDVPLVPALMEQLRQLPQLITRPILSVWDRQFDDVRTLGHLSLRPGDAPSGDAFLVRMKQQNYQFDIESSVSTRDAQGREVIDEIGVLSKGKGKTAAAIKVRRVTLVRNGEDEDDVVLLSNLLDRSLFSAADRLQPPRGAPAVCLLPAALQPRPADQDLCRAGRSRAGQRRVNVLSVQRHPPRVAGLGLSHRRQLAAPPSRCGADARTPESTAAGIMGPDCIHQSIGPPSASQACAAQTPARRPQFRSTFIGRTSESDQRITKSAEGVP
jgi:hypothetical protein